MVGSDAMWILYLHFEDVSKKHQHSIYTTVGEGTLTFHYEVLLDQEPSAVHRAHFLCMTLQLEVQCMQCCVIDREPTRILAIRYSLFAIR